MCFPPEIRRGPFAAAAGQQPRADGAASSRPRVSAEFDLAVSQFMANLQSPLSSGGNGNAFSHTISGLVSQRQLPLPATPASLGVPAAMFAGLPSTDSLLSALQFPQQPPLQAPAPLVGITARVPAMNQLTAAAVAASVAPAAVTTIAGIPSSNFTSSDDEESKKVRRIMSNRQSAKRSRQRKRERLDELEEEVAALRNLRAGSEAQLKSAERSMAELRAANARLREQLERLKGGLQAAGIELNSPADVKCASGANGDETASRSTAVSSRCQDNDDSSACRMSKRFKVESVEESFDGAAQGDGSDSLSRGDADGSVPSSGVTIHVKVPACEMEASAAPVAAGLGLFEASLYGAVDEPCGFDGLGNTGGCFMGAGQPGMEFLDDSLVRSMLDCLGDGELIL
eukprot:TRINITY_DN40552_c0_g1_i1.p1 TRINITY_DN40552_c0_g1~~TRINITY_DN40552_c0_g1_i1.p1  ORF type:complete len:400 (+),score=3.96 TRINITY_DN40552_c0_g1_i1:105-1304(+)